MLGPMTQPNGTMLTVMAATLEEPRLMSVRRLPELSGSCGGDRWGCKDTDGDGWSDLGDAFIHEPTQWRDSDGDGFGDRLPDIKAMPVRRCGTSSWTDWAAATPMAMAGPTRPMLGRPPFGMTPSPPNHCNGGSTKGFGDLPLGAFRDDCPNEAGSSMRDVQGCPDQMETVGPTPTVNLL